VNFGGWTRCCSINSIVTFVAASVTSRLCLCFAGFFEELLHSDGFPELFDGRKVTLLMCQNLCFFMKLCANCE
jgi:hypothetical protein